MDSLLSIFSLLDNFGEEYEVGDCLVVLPQNDPALVELLMSTLGWDPQNMLLHFEVMVSLIL
jgi:sulfite reductase alpha subunit-like flavoprotein